MGIGVIGVRHNVLVMGRFVVIKIDLKLATEFCGIRNWGPWNPSSRRTSIT